jgi:hypothetical protein
MDYTDEAVKNVKVEVDTEMSDKSENAVSNKVIKLYVDEAVSNLPSVEVIDNLESDSATAALSANQGRVIKEYVDGALSSINATIATLQADIQKKATNDEVNEVITEMQDNEKVTAAALNEMWLKIEDIIARLDLMNGK